MNERMDRARLGSVGKLEDGRTFVRFERQLPYTVERVWAAITDPEELAHWFPEIRLERRQGGRFEIRFGGDCDGPGTVRGSVVEYDPPHVLQCGDMRWELHADGAGCRLVFSDVLMLDGPRGEAEITDAVLGGWHHYLDHLEDALAGRAVDASRPEPDYSRIEVPGRAPR